MREDNIVQKKSYAFAVKMTKLCMGIQKEQREFIISRQLLKSGTSIGANIEEAIGGQSKRDFYAKLTISYKEARESHYWIRLMADVGMIDETQKKEYLDDADELLKLIGSIQRTMRKNMEK